ncbi:MAG: LysR substrate-binding domain-containing protein [Alphaproteobacteria bacterium]
MIELRHLRYFVAVAEELHFGRAAQRLRIAQPALSQQIKALEAEIGGLLLSRTRRSVVLTDAGMAFLRRANVILQSTADAAIETKRIARGEKGSIAIGFMSAAMLDQFPPFLKSLREALPDASVNLVQMASDEQIEAVAKGHLTAGFVDIAPRRKDIEVGAVRVAAQQVWEERLLAALPPHHRLANQSVVPLAALAEDDFITLTRKPATGFFDQTIALCQDAGFSPRIRAEVAQLPVALTLIAAGYGVGLAPACVCPPWENQLAFVNLTSKPKIGVTLIWRRDDASPILAVLRKCIDAQAPRLIEWANRRT